MLRRRKVALVIAVVAVAGLLLAGTAYARSLSVAGPDQAANQGCGGADMGEMHSIMWPSLAKSLGLTTDQLDKELAGGKSLEQIAAEKGISSDKLAEQMLAAMKTALGQQVAQGKLTDQQEQTILDAAKKHMTPEHIAAMGSMNGGMGAGSGMDSMHNSMHGADSGTGTTSGGSCHGDDAGGGATSGGMMSPGGTTRGGMMNRGGSMMGQPL